MKNFEFKTVKKLYINEIKRKKRSIILWSAALFGITALYMLLFSVVKEMFVEKMEALPPELTELFGMSGGSGFTNYNTYFTSVVSILIVAVSAFAASVGSGIFRDEEATGAIEFTNALPVGRTELWTAKVVAALTVVTAPILSVTVSALISGAIVASDEIAVGSIIAAMLLAYLIVLIFLAVGFLAACGLKKSIKPAPIGLGILFGTYLLGYLSAIGPDAVSFLKHVSPFDFLSLGGFMSSSAGVGDGAFGISGVITALVLIPLLTASAYFLYRKRDF
ncbi:MAG: ABC transporter permease [Clostridiales bacterium]|jgi:ABC-2 type transport system permease protein|nr:ABC transporter permease [Clostridiales bacterium]